MRSRTKLGALAVAGVIALAVVIGGTLHVMSSRSPDKPLLRVDRAPLEARLSLPTGVISVRWVAVAAFSDSGWLEAPEKPYDLYALLELAPAIPRSSTVQSVVLPESAARAVLPASVVMSAPDEQGNVRVSGTAWLAPIPSRQAGVAVRAAVQVEAGLLLHMVQSGGS